MELLARHAMLRPVPPDSSDKFGHSRQDNLDKVELPCPAGLNRRSAQFRVPRPPSHRTCPMRTHMSSLGALRDGLPRHRSRGVWQHELKG